MTPPATAKPKDREQKRREHQSAAASGFDADARLEKRGKNTVKIGGNIYFRRVKNNAVSLEIREIGREQDKAIRRGALARKKLEDIDLEDEVGIEALEDDAYAADDDALEYTYKITQVLLRDEDGEPPTLEELKEHVDVEDLRQINRLGGGEQLEGPTQTPTS